MPESSAANRLFMVGIALLVAPSLLGSLIGPLWGLGAMTAGWISAGSSLYLLYPKKCQEEKELRSALQEATRLLRDLTRREMKIEKTGNLEELELLLGRDLRRAQSTKDNLAHAYSVHIRQHGC